MTLTEEDVQILGIDLEEYSHRNLEDKFPLVFTYDELKYGIAVIHRVGFNDKVEDLKIIQDKFLEMSLRKALLLKIKDICLKLKLIDKELKLDEKYNYQFDEYAKAFEKVIKGTIELREKREKAKYPIRYLGLVELRPEGGEIPDDKLHNYNSPEDVLEILRERNISRLDSLFKEQENKGE
jgi:hypothetical protein